MSILQPQDAGKPPPFKKFSCETGRDDAFLARELVQLCSEVPLPISAGELPMATRWQGPAEEEADPFFARLGFRHPLQELRFLVQQNPWGGRVERANRR